MKNQGEVISLIIFVILTLGLAVGTYFGFKGLGEQKAELATAQSELQNVQNDNYTLAGQLAAVKDKVGFAPDLECSEILVVMTDDINAALGDQGLLVGTYRSAVADLKKNVAALDAQIATLSADRDAQIQNANASVVQAQTQQTTFIANVDAAQTAQATALQTARDNYNRLTSDFVDQTKSFDDVSYEARNAVLAAQKETAENREAANRYADINVDLSSRIDELSRPDFQRADGYVVYADQVGKTVRLDVGSDDGVRPLMTLSVYPPEYFEEGGVTSKGSVQIVRIMEAHASEAKIVDDIPTDPIQPGDIVYTSLWRSGEIDQYALCCRLDVNGDGYSDLNELINLVESNGFKVAAYIDDLGRIHGELSPRVNRVIVPNLPLSSQIASDLTLSDEQRQAILDAETKFLADARANGVRQMRLADFLVRMDYKDTDQVVRNAQTPTDSEPYSVVVSNEPTAPAFKSSETVSGSKSPGVIRGTGDAVSDDVDDSVDRYFRKRTPNL